MSFRCGHAALWSSTFMHRLYIALKWAWWLRVSLRAHDPIVVGIYSEPGVNLYVTACKLPQLALHRGQSVR